ncbi:MAG: Hint domain-containing protein [Pseudomonadota bacterium]
MASLFVVDDEDFGVATGSNVNLDGTRSRFDGPPAESTDLVIYSQPGDPSPNVFSVGDTYDLSYINEAAPFSGGTFDNAVVLRSDEAPDGGHVVVFEGTNENGDVEHIVWAPGVDLEDWYETAILTDPNPDFFFTDQDATTQYQNGSVCFSPETRITTRKGEVAAGDLQVGDLVLTLDHGFQPILWVGRRKVPIDQDKEGAQPVLIQPNAVEAGGVRHRVVVSPQHRLLLRDPNGDERLAPAKAFVGLKGIRHMRGRRSIEYVTLLLAQHSVLDASGLAAESFLPGPQSYCLLTQVEVAAVEQVVSDNTLSKEPARPCIGGSSGRRAINAGARPVAFQSIRLNDTQSA